MLVSMLVPPLLTYHHGPKTLITAHVVSQWYHGTCWPNSSLLVPITCPAGRCSGKINLVLAADVLGGTLWTNWYCLSHAAFPLENRTVKTAFLPVLANVAVLSTDSQGSGRGSELELLGLYHPMLRHEVTTGAWKMCRWGGPFSRSARELQCCALASLVWPFGSCYQCVAVAVL